MKKLNESKKLIEQFLEFYPEGKIKWDDDKNIFVTLDNNTFQEWRRWRNLINIQKREDNRRRK